MSEIHGCLQTLGLLGETLEHEAVARFLRHCPGLSKQTIGDLLGENDQFFLDVLDAFTGTFSFRGAHPRSAMLFRVSVHLCLKHAQCSPFHAHAILHSRTPDKALLTASQKPDPRTHVFICAGLGIKVTT